MSEFGKRLFQKASYRLYRWVEGYLGQRNIAKAEARGAKFGDFWRRIDGRRRFRVDQNLKLAFPDMSASEREEMMKDIFHHFGIVAADFFRTPFRTDEELLASVTVPDWEPYYAAAALEKGIIAVPPHLGNWERFGHWLQATGRHITVVARDADESTITQRVTELRKKNGMGVLSRGDSAREILRLLRRKEIVGLLPDQNSREAYISFFGHPAGTVLGPAVMAIRTGAPLLPCSLVRTGIGKYELIFEPPIFATKDDQPEEITERLNSAIEGLIRRAPSQYLWIHDRWKSARRRNMLPPEFDEGGK